MLEEFVTLEKGDGVVQNGANSAVGQVLSQINCSMAKPVYKGVLASDMSCLMLNKLLLFAVRHPAG